MAMSRKNAYIFVLNARYRIYFLTLLALLDLRFFSAGRRASSFGASYMAQINQ